MKSVNSQDNANCRTFAGKVNISIWDSSSKTYLEFPKSKRIHSWTTTLVSFYQLISVGTEA